MTPELESRLAQEAQEERYEPGSEPMHALRRGAELALQWRTIESAPKDQLVIVYTPPQPGDWPDEVRINFDYIDSGISDDFWYHHGEHYEHYCCVALPENSVGPFEKAPYTHWMPLPLPPGEPE